MLRLLLGETALEKLQSEEISRLRAQVSDLQHALLDQAESARLTQAEAYKSFLGFLRPSTSPSDPYTPPAPQQWPGERPDTSPAYPEKPLWAKGEIKAAKEVPA